LNAPLPLALAWKPLAVFWLATVPMMLVTGLPLAFALFPVAMLLPLSPAAFARTPVAILALSAPCASAV
jgi:hypothetical protein